MSFPLTVEKYCAKSEPNLSSSIGKLGGFFAFPLSGGQSSPGLHYIRPDSCKNQCKPMEQILRNDARSREGESAFAAGRYALVSVIFFGLCLIFALGRIPVSPPSEPIYHTSLALATLLLILFGFAYVPVAAIALLTSSIATWRLGGDASFDVTDFGSKLVITCVTAAFARRFWVRGRWGTPRDYVALGSCILLGSVLLAATEVGFFRVAKDANAFGLVWIGALLPI